MFVMYVRVCVFDDGIPTFQPMIIGLNAIIALECVGCGTICLRLHSRKTRMKLHAHSHGTS